MLCSAVAKAFKEGCSGYTTEVLTTWEADYEADFGVASLFFLRHIWQLYRQILQEVTDCE